MADSASCARSLRLSVVLTALALVTACTTAQQITYSGQSNGPGQPEQSASEPVGTLAGTAWRLVEIRSTDGTVDRPGDEARYMLYFDADGAVRIMADCNRGRGTWASEHPSKLRFGAIATTQMMCPEGSISDRYLSYFQRVRSYALREGRLLLTTGAQGPTIEFAPAEADAGDG